MIVLDCSAAVHIAQQSPEGRALQALLLQGERIVSSDLLKVEVPNMFWKMTRYGELPVDQAGRLIDLTVSLVDEFVSPDIYMRDAYEEGIRLRHPTDDLFYLLIAKRHRATLLTLDNRLAALCDEMGVDRIHDVTW